MKNSAAQERINIKKCFWWNFNQRHSAYQTIIIIIEISIIKAVADLEEKLQKCKEEILKLAAVSANIYILMLQLYAVYIHLI